MRFIVLTLFKEMFDAFVNSTFNTDPKYKIRNDEISKYEEDNEY